MGWFRKGKGDKPGKPGRSRKSGKGDGSSEPLPDPSSSVDLDGLEAQVDVELAPLQAALERSLPHMIEQPVDRMLVHARLADAYRRQGQTPMPAAAFSRAVEPLDDEAWRRLALLVSLLEEPRFREDVMGLVDERRGARPQVEEAFVGFAKHATLLTVAVLRDGELRREELLRRFVQHLGAGIEGETLEQSLERLERLDYGDLLDAAERAKQIAQERMAYLDKLQEAQDAARRPRGKW